MGEQDHRVSCGLSVSHHRPRGGSQWCFSRKDVNPEGQDFIYAFCGGLVLNYPDGVGSQWWSFCEVDLWVGVFESISSG